MVSSGCVENTRSHAGRPRHRRQFGMAVRRRRQGLGLSQEKLAEAADCHRAWRQNLSLDSMVRFAKALKCSLADLFGNAGL